MRLLISDIVVQKIVGFAKKFGLDAPVFEDLTITVRLATLSLIFSQPERYSQSIACHFSFGPNVGFFFEDVLLAMGGKADSQQGHTGEHISSHEVLNNNDQYVLRVLKYCEENINLLTALPPPWFLTAVQISDAATRKYFPDIADTDLRQKRALWESWQKASRQR